MLFKEMGANILPNNESGPVLNVIYEYLLRNEPGFLSCFFASSDENGGDLLFSLDPIRGADEDGNALDLNFFTHAITISGVQYYVIGFTENVRPNYYIQLDFSQPAIGASGVTILDTYNNPLDSLKVYTSFKTISIEGIIRGMGANLKFDLR